VVSWVHLQSAADFVVLTGSPAPVLPPFGLLETVPDWVLERARWWERHIVELQTGCLPGAEEVSRRRAQYDPARHPMNVREQAKLAELSAGGELVGLSTLRRMRHDYAVSGLWGLIDRRGMRPVRPLGEADPRLVAAIMTAIAEATGSSTGTRGRLRRPGGDGPDRRARPGRSSHAVEHDVLPTGRRLVGGPVHLRLGPHPPVAGQPPRGPVRIRGGRPPR
jgi:hypothetical protein